MYYAMLPPPLVHNIEEDSHIIHTGEHNQQHKSPVQLLENPSRKGLEFFDARVINESTPTPFCLPRFLVLIVAFVRQTISSYRQLISVLYYD